MCHSDHHLVTGGIDGRLPGARRDEGAGIVTEVGPGVEDTGARRPRRAVVHTVLWQVSVVSGRDAQPLRSGRRAAGWSRGVRRDQPRPRQGPDRLPDDAAGHLQPYMVVHKSSVVKIDPSIPFEVACLVGCGVTTGYGSATRTADIRPGQDAAIVGVGGVGIAALQGAVNAGARYIFIDPGRRVEARSGVEAFGGHRMSTSMSMLVLAKIAVAQEHAASTCSEDASSATKAGPRPRTARHPRLPTRRTPRTRPPSLRGRLAPPRLADASRHRQPHRGRRRHRPLLAPSSRGPPEHQPRQPSWTTPGRSNSSPTSQVPVMIAGTGATPQVAQHTDAPTGSRPRNAAQTIDRNHSTV